ncbi:MAG: hypothetical protein NTW28_35285 [Candidatus Solibacter sp.]|nr:hypothetical protein [Candidatus Solibacter sp.]
MKFRAAPAGHVKLGDQRRTVVSHNVLRMILGLGAGVAVHFSPHAIQEHFQFQQSLVPVLGPLGEQRPHPYVAPHRAGQGVQNLEIVTAEHGEHKLFARPLDHLQNGFPALARVKDQPLRGRIHQFDSHNRRRV